MATVNISKISVREKQKNLYIITLNMQYLDGEDILWSQNFEQEYRTGDNIADLAQRFDADMQEAIDTYKQEQVYYNHAQMDALVAWLNTNVTP